MAVHLLTVMCLLLCSLTFIIDASLSGVILYSVRTVIACIEVQYELHCINVPILILHPGGFKFVVSLTENDPDVLIYDHSTVK